MSETHPDWLKISAAGVDDQVVVDRAQFATNECRAVFDWWAGFSPELPTREQVPLAQFSKLLPSLYLSQLMDDRRFEVRIQGERVKAMLGDGAFPSSFSIDEAGFPGLMASNYREAIHRKVALRHSGTMQLFDRGHVRFESADYPLRASAGGSPYILGLIREIS